VKRTLAAAALAVAMITPGALLAPAALAHSELVSTDPADGATLDAPPTTVSFTFNEALMPDFVRFVGTDPSGQTGDLPVTSVEGPTASIDWPAGAPAGEWTVSYRVVSQDGHPVEGGITFSYAAASTSPTPTSPAPTSTAPTSPTPTSVAPSPSTSPAADTTGGGSGLLIAGLAVGVIVIVGVVIALVARRRA
jgi:methionine-rich copper-binding protein CopC